MSRNRTAKTAVLGFSVRRPAPRPFSTRTNDALRRRVGGGVTVEDEMFLQLALPGFVDAEQAVHGDVLVALGVAEFAVGAPSPGALATASCPP